MDDTKLESPFRVSLAAKVVKAWRDSRYNCINEDTDFLTMSLEIPSWPEGDTLLARIRNHVGEPEAMIEGKMYDISGRVYFKKGWHRQYLYITGQRESPEVSDTQQVRPPLFEVFCNITGVISNNKIGLMWGVRDEYENQSENVRQYISTTCPYPKEVVAKKVHKLWRIGGRMLGTNDLGIREMTSIDYLK